MYEKMPLRQVDASRCQHFKQFSTVNFGNNYEKLSAPGASLMIAGSRDEEKDWIDKRRAGYYSSCSNHKKR